MLLATPHSPVCCEPFFSMRGFCHVICEESRQKLPLSSTSQNTMQISRIEGFRHWQTPGICESSKNATEATQTNEAIFCDHQTHPNMLPSGHWSASCCGLGPVCCTHSLGHSEFSPFKPKTSNKITISNFSRSFVLRVILEQDFWDQSSLRGGASRIFLCSVSSDSVSSQTMDVWDHLDLLSRAGY